MAWSWIFAQECLIKRLSGIDGWKSPVYSDPQLSACRWQVKQRLVRGTNGEEVMAVAEVWLPPGTTIKPEDILIYPVGGEEYRVIACGDAVMLDGKTAYMKAWC
jgi:hypothetical protein